MPYKILTVLLASLALASAWAAPESAPDRQRGEGPFDQLILRGVTVVNGEGAPPVGPMDVVIENGRIASLHNVGYPGLPIEPGGRPELDEGGRELDLEGFYVLPGFVDLHAHFGGDAQGEAVVTVGHGGRVFQGKGFDTDIIVASAQAYVQAINRICAAAPGPAALDAAESA